MKKLLSFLNTKNLKLEIKRCGYEFSFWRYIRFLLMSFAGLVAFAFVFKLKIQFIVPLLIMALVLLPNIFLLGYRNMYEQRKFEQVTSYMEQMLYSFKREPKILSALKDTVILFQEPGDEVLRSAIEQAIEHIQNGVSEGNIYRSAFAFIEKEYRCKRLTKMHNFLIQVEEAGGESGDSADILLMDRNMWIDRIYYLIQEKQKIRINVTIAIGLSLLIVGMSIYMIPDNFGIAQSTLSQTITMISLMLDFLLWFVVQRMLSKSLLLADADVPFSEIRRSYEIVMHDGFPKVKRKFRMLAVLAGIGTVPAYLWISRNAAIMFGVFAVILWTQPNRQLKTCKKRIVKEIQKAFPEWLLSLALQMQTDNVHVSIAKTVPNAPQVLREDLYVFLDSIEKYPESLEPYINFLHDFYIGDITSTMKMLYAMQEYGAENSQQQIRTIVERNTKMMDRAETIKMEDQLAGISFSMMLPMITGVIKMITDLALVMAYILSRVNVT